MEVPHDDHHDDGADHHNDHGADHNDDGADHHTTTAPTTTTTAPTTTTTAPPNNDAWPAAHNTGFPHGLPGDTRTPVTLAPYAGPCGNITQPTVIDSKDITCQLNVRSAGVVIKNSRFRVSSTGAVNVNNRYHALIMDTEFDGQHRETPPAVSRLSATVVIPASAAISMGPAMAHANWGGVAFVDSWIHDLFCLQSSCHNDGIQSTGWTDGAMARLKA